MKKIFGQAVFFVLIMGLMFCPSVAQAGECEIDVEDEGGGHAASDPCVVAPGTCDLKSIIDLVSNLDNIGETDVEWCHVSGVHKGEYAAVILVPDSAKVTQTITLKQHYLIPSGEEPECYYCNLLELPGGDRVVHYPIIIAGYDVQIRGKNIDSNFIGGCGEDVTPMDWNSLMLRDVPYRENRFFNHLHCVSINKPESSTQKSIEIDVDDESYGFHLKQDAYLSFRNIKLELKNGAAAWLDRNDLYNAGVKKYAAQLSFKNSSIVVHGDNTAKYVIHTSYPEVVFKKHVLGGTTPLLVTINGHSDLDHQISVLDVPTRDDAKEAVSKLIDRAKLQLYGIPLLHAQDGVSLASWRFEKPEDAGPFYCWVIAQQQVANRDLRCMLDLPEPYNYTTEIYRFSAGPDSGVCSFKKASWWMDGLNSGFLVPRDAALFTEDGRRILVKTQPCPSGARGPLFMDDGRATCKIDNGRLFLDSTGKNWATTECDDGYIAAEGTCIQSFIRTNFDYKKVIKKKIPIKKIPR